MARGDPPSYLEGTRLVEQSRLGPQPPISIVIDIEMGTEQPQASYERSLDELSAFDQANFRSGDPDVRFTTERVSNSTPPASYVESVLFAYPRRRFEFLVARELNPRGPGRHNTPSWIFTLRTQVLAHGQEHFRRYRWVLSDVRARMLADFGGLPSRENPVSLPQRELEAWLDSLMRFWHHTVEFELKRSSCEWDREDYPRIENRMRSLRRLNLPLPSYCQNLGPAPVRPFTPHAVVGRRRQRR